MAIVGGALAGQKNPGAPGNIPPAAKPRLAEAIQRLIDLYTAWEKPEQAAEWQEKLEATKIDGIR